MAAAMLSTSDSFHASLIIHRQLQQQQQQQQQQERLQNQHGLGVQSKESTALLKPEVKGKQSVQEQHTEGAATAVGFCDQLMLVSALLGIEMAMSFNQIYEVLFLQFLGVPLALVSVNGILAGCTSMIFLPLVGAWADGGNNPKSRKLISLFGGLLVFLGGLLLLIIASLIKIEQLEGILDDLHSPGNRTAGENLSNALNKELAYNASVHNNASTATQAFPGRVSTTTPADATATEESILDYARLPGIVFISILGFASLDMGFDVTVSLSRAMILENVPRFQHMRVLLLATIVQSSAGTSCSLIGCFDLPGFLESVFETDGTAATLVFFCCILITATLIGFFLMSLASYRLRRRNIAVSIPPPPGSVASQSVTEINCSSQRHSASTSFKVTASQSGKSDTETGAKTYSGKQSDVKRRVTPLQEERPYVPDILHTEEGDTSTKPLLLEDSLKVSYAAVNYAAIPPFSYTEGRQETPNQQNVGSYNGVDDVSNTPADTTPVSYSDAENMSERSSSSSSSSAAVAMVPARSLHASVLRLETSTGVSAVLAAVRQSYSMSTSQQPGPGLGDFYNRKLDQLRQAQSRVSSRERADRRRRLNRRLAVLCVATFFAIGGSVTCGMYASNAVTLGILHGEPGALPGTPGRDNYDRGLRLGAIGNFIMYSSFLAISVGNSKIVDVIGERGQFMLTNALLIAALVAVIATRLVEVFFLLMVFCGFFRTCMLTLPFVMAHKFTQEGMDTENLDPEAKVSHTGRVMTLIGFLIPAHYMILSILMGPLMETTGNSFVPLFYSLGSSSVSLGVFSLLFFI